MSSKINEENQVVHIVKVVVLVTRNSENFSLSFLYFYMILK